MQADTPTPIAAPQPGASLSVWVYQLLSRGCSACSQAMQERRRKAQLQSELQGLESRELADLGIGRGELDYWLSETLPAARTRP
jgi:uncharacterized protein YjiS (DUF1127 family)